SGEHAGASRPPIARRASCENDGRSLDGLDRAGEEHGDEQRASSHCHLRPESPRVLLESNNCQIPAMTAVSSPCPSGPAGTRTTRNGSATVAGGVYLAGLAFRSWPCFSG